MGEQPRIPVEYIQTALREEYGLTSVTLEFLPLGLDYNAGVYRVRDEHGTSYLLKIKAGPFYKPSCLVPRYLHDQGITAVVAPLPTRSNALWNQVEHWTLMLYPFIEGDTSWTGMTTEHWRRVGATFRQIHQTVLPPIGIASLQRETFDPTEYVRWIHDFEAQHAYAVGKDEPQRMLLATWTLYRSTIHTVVAALEELAGLLQRQAGAYVICHADLHPANLIRTADSDVFVIDWDDVMLAPKERDFIFVREPHAEAFFQGYGPTTIDWIALTYYLWERIVQEVVVCTQNGFFREDLGEESRTTEAQLLRDTLSNERGDIDAVYAAAAHL